MLTGRLNKLSDFLTLDRAWIPNLITFFVVVIILFISLKSQLEWTGLLIIYAIFMTILKILGIDSVFNILTIIETIWDTIIDLIFLKVV